VVLVACEPLQHDASRNPFCTPTGQRLDVSGAWDFSGTLTFENCPRRSSVNEGRVVPFHTRRPFAVEQVDANLTGGDPAATSVHGNVAGDCVNATVTDHDGSDVTIFELAGVAYARDGAPAYEVSGTFTGSALGCDTEGDFRVTISR